MATLANLSSRLRVELGDLSKTFLETFTGNGIETRFQLTEAPVNGTTMIIKVANVNVSNSATVEEVQGLVTLAVAPANNAQVIISGTTYKYFTDAELESYVDTAFLQHSSHSTDSNGSQITLTTLAPIEEYPILLLASTMALYTLATDAAFDIDIISPDGVSIPRSERFRQLNEIIALRKEQYRELCKLLGLGLHKIEMFTLRRISRTTNRYVPVYRPQEIGDRSLPQRVQLPIPDYWDTTPASAVPTQDLNMYSGDDFSIMFQFSFNVTLYTPKSQIRLDQGTMSSQVGPVILGEFSYTTLQSNPSNPSGANYLVYDTLRLSLPGETVDSLPRVSYWDLQLTKISNGIVKTYMQGKVYTDTETTT